MRIPAEALLPYPSENDRFSDAPGTRPVDSSARLPARLPEKPRQTYEAPDERDERYEPVVRRAPRAAPYETPERRQADRRKAALPVTLDTRVTRSRRHSTSPSAVNIKI